MIPKFIFGEDVSGEREFIIHAHEPIIIYERVEEGEGFTSLKAVYSQITKDDADAAILARLSREAGDAWFIIHAHEPIIIYELEEEREN